jgi:hypothetical protein
MTNPVPASDLAIGNVIQLDEVGPATVTRLDYPIDRAQITIHYTLLDTALAAPNNTGWVTVLKTDLISVS